MSEPTPSVAEQAFEMWWKAWWKAQSWLGSKWEVAKETWIAAYTQGAREEREACAKVAENDPETWDGCPDGQDCGSQVADAIRHREEGR